MLGLIREGLTNEQIASRLGITERGARFHVSEILSKLYVSSRAEAAAWQPQTRNRFAIAAVLFRGAQGVIALAAIAFITLAVGVAISSLRGNGASEPRSVSNAPRNGSLDELLGLAREAEFEAIQILPGAELVLVGYSTASGSYTFRFSEPGSAKEVSVLGPGLPGFPRWELLAEDRPADIERLERLDVSAIRRSPREIAEAAERKSARSAQNMGVTVWSDQGRLQWQALAPIDDRSLVTCIVMDVAPLDQIVCER